MACFIHTQSGGRGALGGLRPSSRAPLTTPRLHPGQSQDLACPGRQLLQSSCHLWAPARGAREPASWQHPGSRAVLLTGRGPERQAPPRAPPRLTKSVSLLYASKHPPTYPGRRTDRPHSRNGHFPAPAAVKTDASISFYCFAIKNVYHHPPNWCHVCRAHSGRPGTRRARGLHLDRTGEKASTGACRLQPSRAEGWRPVLWSAPSCPLRSSW